jgi:hypothetical protein
LYISSKLVIRVISIQNGTKKPLAIVLSGVGRRVREKGGGHDLTNV